MMYLKKLKQLKATGSDNVTEGKDIYSESDRKLLNIYNEILE